MNGAKRKILFSGLLGIVSVGMFASDSFAAEQPAWIRQMSKPALHETVGKAIVTNDYNAFLTAIEGEPGSRDITHTEFAVLVKAYKLHEQGSTDQAQKILTTIG